MKPGFLEILVLFWLYVAFAAGMLVWGGYPLLVRIVVLVGIVGSGVLLYAFRPDSIRDRERRVRGTVQAWRDEASRHLWMHWIRYGLLFALVLSVASAVSSMLTAEKGYWHRWLQYAMNGWPEDYERLPPAWFFFGVLAQTLVALGFPILLATLIRELLARSVRSTIMDVFELLDRHDSSVEAEVRSAIARTLAEQEGQRITPELTSHLYVAVHYAILDAMKELREVLGEETRTRWEEVRLPVS